MNCITIEIPKYITWGFLVSTKECTITRLLLLVPILFFMNYKYFASFLVISILIITSLTIQNIQLDQQAAILRSLQTPSARTQTADFPSRVSNPTTPLNRENSSCTSCSITVNEKTYSGARINGFCYTGYTCASSANGGFERVGNPETTSSGPIPADLQNLACTSCIWTNNEKKYTGARINGVCYTGYTCASSVAGGELRPVPIGGTTSTGASLTTDMWKGNLANNTAEVIILQNFLISKGYLATDNATGKFGPATMEAVIKFQSANRLPATGYVGEKTRTVINAQM